MPTSRPLPFSSMALAMIAALPPGRTPGLEGISHFLARAVSGWGTPAQVDVPTLGPHSSASGFTNQSESHDPPHHPPPVPSNVRPRRRRPLDRLARPPGPRG